MRGDLVALTALTAAAGADDAVAVAAQWLGSNDAEKALSGDEAATGRLLAQARKGAWGRVAF